MLSIKKITTHVELDAALNTLFIHQEGSKPRSEIERELLILEELGFTLCTLDGCWPIYIYYEYDDGSILAVYLKGACIMDSCSVVYTAHYSNLSGLLTNASGDKVVTFDSFDELYSYLNS